jgi:tetratricopeptide (TPR) repeat protein
LLPGGILSEPPSVELQGVDPAASEAIRAASDRVRRERGSAEAWGRLGKVLLAHDFVLPAALCLEQAGLRDAADPRWPYLEGLAFLKGTPDVTGALSCLKAAAEKRSAPPSVKLKLAEVLLEQGKVDEAAAWLLRVLEADPRGPRVNAGLSRVAYLRGDLKQALERLSLSAAGAPGVRATRALLAEVHRRIGNLAAAEAERKAMAELPDADRWPDPYWEQVRELWTGVMASIERANDFYQQGRAAEAIQLLRDSSQRYPNALLLPLSLGRFLLQSGNAAEAEVALRRALSLAPDSFEGCFELGSALQAQNKVAEAALAFEDTLRLKPDWPPAHYGLAQCRLRAGDRGGAIESLRAAVRFRPSYAQAHRDLAYLLLQAENRGEAILHLESALKLNPADREAARLLEAAGR